MTQFSIRTLLLLASMGASFLCFAGGNTVFTYQGKINQSGAPANGSFDFQFQLFASAQGGTPLATSISNGVSVVDGIFSVEIDYQDPANLAAGPVFLEIAVGPGGGGATTLLSPRTPINRTPHAVFADIADFALEGGNDIAQWVVVSADGSASENGSALIAAFAAITDASANKPYTVFAGPGLYDLGSTGLATKPFVSLKGAGTTSTVLTAAGATSNFSADNGTLILSDDMVAEDLTIRTTGGMSTDAIAVLGAGQRYTLRNARIEVFRNDASVATGFVGANLPGGGLDFSGQVIGVDIMVDTGNGIGGFPGIGDTVSLVISDCTITVLGQGVGIGDGGFSGINSELVVRDTRIDVLGGGIGAGLSSPDSQRFQNLVVNVSGGSGSNSGFSDAGSGFRPEIFNSVITVSGSDSAIIRTNTGNVRITGSQLSASIGIDADTSTAAFAGFYHINDSQIDATTGFYLRTGGSTHRVFLNNVILDVSTVVISNNDAGGNMFRAALSQFDASNTNINLQNGTLDAICFGVYDENYNVVGANCI